MPRNAPLPPELGSSFSVAAAKTWGVGDGRLRGSDLARPFHGIRTITAAEARDTGPEGMHERERRRREVAGLARAYAPKLGPGQFFSHTTAAVLWGAPVPLDEATLHVSVAGPGSFPRARGVTGHRVQPWMSNVGLRDGMLVADPASVWASLGALPLVDLVILGDFLCRVWRDGFLRENVGMPPLATPADLAAALAAGRRLGAGRLREAFPLIRLDSWSPMESLCRCILVAAGLPEPPVLNGDVYAEGEGFLGCVDLCYPEYKIAIEYQSTLHSARYAKDVERLARLRANGWIVIEVTADLVRDHRRLADRVRQALIERGWRS